jgi:hypothetical protein
MALKGHFIDIRGLTKLVICDRLISQKARSNGKFVMLKTSFRAMIEPRY